MVIVTADVPDAGTVNMVSVRGRDGGGNSFSFFVFSALNKGKTITELVPRPAVFGDLRTLTLELVLGGSGGAYDNWKVSHCTLEFKLIVCSFSRSWTAL